MSPTLCLSAAFALVTLAVPQSLGADRAPPAAARAALEVTRPALPPAEPAVLEVDSKGEVEVTLYNLNSREERTFTLTLDGEHAGDSKELARFFRCKRSGRSRAMAPELMGMLAAIAREYPGHTIELVSGFRRRGQGARRSKHYIGNAVDVRVRDVPLETVRDFLWSRYEDIGLGYYPRRHLHIDFRPGEGKIGWDARKGRYRYHPRWTLAGS